VVIPNFNHGGVIARQLSAIWAQSVQPTRLVIVDDASTDDSISRIEALIDARRGVELRRNARNLGVVATLNAALNDADTECITFPGADDLLMPGYIESCLTLLAGHPGAAVCAAICRVKAPGDEWLVPDRTAWPLSSAGFLAPQAVRESIERTGTWFMSNTVMLRRAPLAAVGGLPADLGSYADEFIYTVLALRHGACFIPEQLATNLQSADSYSVNTRKDTRRLERIVFEAHQRMRGEFADLFTPKLLHRTSSRLFFMLMSAELDALEARAREVAGSVVSITAPGAVIFAISVCARALKLMVFGLVRFQDIPRVVRSRLMLRLRRLRRPR
jgi:glycosyltransferase involved in cell wall biosynthesis